MTRHITNASILAAVLATALGTSAALAQSTTHDHGQPAAQQDSSATPQGGAGGMMDSSMMGGQQMAPPGGMMRMMQQGSPMHGGMAMPCGMMGDGMMAMMHGRGQMPMMGGMHRGSDGGMRVAPIQHLTQEDVAHYFEHWLARQGNDRLKVGAVTQVDDDTITADIVTVDDSLVQRFRVDRHSGQATLDKG